MKKPLLTTILLLVFLLKPPITFAQGMTGGRPSSPLSVTSDGHTAREEQEGKEIWEKLQAKETTCDKLSDEDFASLGEYFMGQMAGSSHEAMNNMMVRMMGEEGEEQMHIAMGKRLSDCDTSAQIPSNGVGFMPMMFLLRQGFGGQGMMGGWGGFGILGWLSMLIFWVLLVLGVIALIRYLARSEQSREDKTPLDVLKERYAHGEINKKEFEEKKKDLS